MSREPMGTNMETNVIKSSPSVLRRAVVSNLILVTLFAVALAATLGKVQRTALRQQLQLRAETLIDFIAMQSQFGMFVSDRGALQQIASNALAVDDVFLVEFIGPNGELLLKTTKPAAAIGLDSIYATRDILSPGSGGLLEWENNRPPASKLGSVRVGFSVDRQAQIRRRVLSYILGAMLLWLLGIVATQYWQLRGLLRPLRGLMDFAAKAAKGDLKQRALVARPDEIGRLGIAFNKMMDELGSITVSKNYVDNILHSMGEALIVLDDRRSIRTVNQAALSMLGYKKSELIGQPASIFAGHACDLQLPVNSVECTYTLKNGEQIPVLISAAKLPESEPGEVWLAQDISEHKSAEEDLRIAKQDAEDANRAKSELLSRTSHELRTPLNAILGFAQLLDMGELPQLERGNVHQILKAGRHLLKLINEVLDIAGIESGRRSLSLEAVYVRDAVAESIDLVRPQAAGRGISIYDHVETDHWVMADRQRLQQVLINLLSNAVKYNREGGEVFVYCDRQPNGFLRVYVRDTGLGIAVQDLDKVFIPFERLGAEAACVEGTGLGLSFARSFMEAMGGGVGVKSTPGEGSTFWIDVPPAPAAAIPGPSIEPLAKAVSLADERPHHLLYIEDNSSNRALVERIMAHRPAVALTVVSTGTAGIAAAWELHPDVILLDLHLPDIWGDEVIRRLKEDPTTARIPVIMLSADATSRQIESLLDLGAEAYLTKPIDVHNFLAILDKQLAAERPVAC